MPSFDGGWGCESAVLSSFSRGGCITWMSSLIDCSDESWLMELFSGHLCRSSKPHLHVCSVLNINRCCLFWQWWYMMGFSGLFFPPEKWHRESHIWAHGWGMWMEGRWGAGADSKYADRRDRRTPKDCHLYRRRSEYWISFIKEHLFTLTFITDKHQPHVWIPFFKYLTSQ